MARCQSCPKELSDVEALKCHAWSKRICRAALPLPLRAEVEAWDQAPAARCACPGCGRAVANLEEALKAHAWAKPGCRTAIPRAMQDEIEAEEAVATLAAMTRCPSCAKAFSDVEALKCHAWSKRTCRAALPPPLRAEVEAWDQAPVARCVCPGCGRTIANLEEALKAHAWAKPGCRTAIPRTMQRAIAAEEALPQNDWAKTSCCGDADCSLGSS